MRQGGSLKVENLHFSYSDKTIFQGLSIDFDGGFISILGPNGAGKSTLLKLITGSLKAENGDIFINNKSLKTITSNERARIFTAINQHQDFAFPFTCMEMVSLGRFPYRKNINNLSKEDYDLIVKAMKDTDTLKFKDRIITDISGGEQQRVMLATALAQDTDIIFLDEAFSALDISYKARAVKLLKNRVEEENILVISIIHDLNIAYRFSDKVCILDHGKLLAYDVPDVAMSSELINELYDVDLEFIPGKGYFVNL